MMTAGDDKSPFPLDGGRAGDGGDASAAAPRQTKRGVRAVSAPEWAPKKAHAAYATHTGRRLRRAMTLGETQLREALRGLKLHIRRQAPIGPYIVDFVSHTAKLVIEVDGYYHSLPERQTADVERDAWLARQGYRVLRFSDIEVLNNPMAVADRIAADLSPPSPALPPSRGKGES